MFTRRGFLSWLLGCVLLLAGCAPRRETKPAPTPPATPPLPPAQPKPAPAAPAPPPPPKPTPPSVSPPPAPLSRGDIVLTTNEEKNAQVLREKTEAVNDLINGRRSAVKIATPTEQLFMTFRGNQVAQGKHLVLASGAKELNIVPSGTDFVFKNEVGATLVDQGGILGKAGQPVRLGIAQIRDALRNPDKLKGLFSTGTKILVIALAVWLGAKIGLIILAALAWIAFLAILVGLFSMALGPAVQALKLLLAQAGVSEKDLVAWVAKAKAIAGQVIAETIKELRKLPQFAQ